MDVKVSVIIPVYNVEKYLRQCVDSILNQTLQDFEIILINDGSTDESLNILNEYSEKDDRIIVIDKENEGQSIARNIALPKSKGECVIYIDSDDYIEKNCLELLYLKIKETQSDVVVYAHKEVYDDTIIGADAKVKIDVDENKIYTGLEVADMVLNCKFLGTPWNKMFTREILDKSNMYFEPFRYVQDWFPTFKAIFMSDKVAFVNTPLYNYRMRGTATTAKKTEKNIEDYSHATDLIINFANEHGMDENSISVLKCKAFNNIISRKVKTYKENKDIYREYDYQIFKITILEIIKTKKIDGSLKLNLLLYKVKMSHIYMKIMSFLSKVKRSLKNG